MAQGLMGMKLALIAGYDPGGFLSPMLQGMKAKHGQGGGFRMVADAKNPAFIVKFIFLK